VETYQYVGEKHGNYDREHEFNYPDGGLLGARCRTIGLALLVIIVSTFGIYMVYFDRGADEDAGPAATSAHAHQRGHALGARPTAPEVAPELLVSPAQPQEGSRPRYDCSTRGGPADDGDAAKLPAGWAEARDQQGKRYYYNRKSGARQWDRPGGGEKHGWSEDQKAWCCEREQVGCASITTTTTAIAQPSTTTDSDLPFDCRAGYSIWETSWSAEKQEFCCTKFSRGCPDASTTTSETHSESELPAEERPGVRAGEPALEERPATTAALSTTVATTASAKAVHDCSTASPRWEQEWSGKKKRWCCENALIGCPTSSATHSATTPASTSAAASRPSTSMSSSKANMKDSEPATYDCLDTTTNYNWSVGKLKYCCDTHDICIDEPSQPPRSSSGAAKSTASKVVKRAMQGRAQPVHIDVGVADFDCTDLEKGYGRGKGAWSLEQKKWCCEEQNVCLTTSSPPYDCQAGYNNWKAGWSEAKQSWCCANEARGCS
jgi:hypothetical protein